MEHWLDRLSLSRRRLLFAVVTAIFVAAMSLLVALAQDVDPVAMPRASLPPTPPTENPASTPETAEFLADGLPRTAGGAEAPPLSASELAAAERVARAVVVNLATFRHDEPASAQFARLRPYLSPALFRQLERDLAGMNAEPSRALREVSAAEVQHIHTQLVAADQVVFVVVARQQLSTAHDRSEHYPSYTVRVVRPKGPWVASELIF